MSLHYRSAQGAIADLEKGTLRRRPLGLGQLRALRGARRSVLTIKLQSEQVVRRIDVDRSGLEDNGLHLKSFISQQVSPTRIAL